MLMAALPACLVVTAAAGYHFTTTNPFNPLQLQNPATWQPQIWNIAGYAALLPFFVGAGMLLVPAAIAEAYPRYVVGDVPPLCVAVALGIGQVASLARQLAGFLDQGLFESLAHRFAVLGQPLQLLGHLVLLQLKPFQLFFGVGILVRIAVGQVLGLVCQYLFLVGQLLYSCLVEPLLGQLLVLLLQLFQALQGIIEAPFGLRKLLVALWRLATTGEVPHGVVFRPAA